MESPRLLLFSADCAATCTVSNFPAAGGRHTGHHWQVFRGWMAARVRIQGLYYLPIAMGQVLNWRQTWKKFFQLCLKAYESQGETALGSFVLSLGGKSVLVNC